jgi:hypothetical protein
MTIHIDFPPAGRIRTIADGIVLDPVETAILGVVDATSERRVIRREIQGVLHDINTGKDSSLSKPAFKCGYLMRVGQGPDTAYRKRTSVLTP